MSRPEKYFIKRIKYISKYINNVIQKIFTKFNYNI